MATERARRSMSLEAALVARRFYLENMQKSEIATELGISRFKVARLLDEARESGMITIDIDVPTELDLDIGDALAARFGLRRVLVARVLNDRDLAHEVLAAVLAQDLAGTLGPDDLLGLGSGTVLAAMVHRFNARTGTDVVQLVGDASAAIGVGGSELVRLFSVATTGRPFPLHAPLLVDTARFAEQLRGDAGLAPAVSQFEHLTVAVVEIGSWQWPGSSVFGELTDEEAATLRHSGVIADVAGVLLDAAGQVVSSPIADRVVGIGRDQLRRVPDVIAVSAAAGVDAVAAALRSGLISALVIDADSAARLG